MKIKKEKKYTQKTNITVKAGGVRKSDGEGKGKERENWGKWGRPRIVAPKK